MLEKGEKLVDLWKEKGTMNVEKWMEKNPFLFTEGAKKEKK